MRALLLGVVAVVATACTAQHCKKGTLYLTYSLSGSAQAADHIDVTLAIGGAAAQTKTVQQIGHDKSIEVDFGAYPSGQSLAITLTARMGDQILASLEHTIVASAGCTAVSFDLGGAASDLSMAGDLTGVVGPPMDLAGADLTGEDFPGQDLTAAANLDLSTIDMANADMTIAGTLTLLAGSLGNAGSANGTGMTARFNEPVDIVADGNGNLFVTEYNNSTIRQIVIATGEVTTLAGVAGTTGSTNGTGSGALFDNPVGITTDGAGNLFVADQGNNTIRQIVIATGAVTTLAGMAGAHGSTNATGTSALFFAPTGVTYDGAGNLFVTDFSNETIRQIVISSAAVTLLAGTVGTHGTMNGTGTNAQFYGPEDIVSDGAGNLFVADRYNCGIRQIVVSSASVTTLAGSLGACGSMNGTGTAALFYNPTGITYDGVGSLYVGDDDNSTIRKIVIASGVVSTVVGVAGQTGVKLGALPAGLSRPAFVTFFDDDLAITDSSGDAVLIAHHPF